jgi:hypothetical protein
MTVYIAINFTGQVAVSMDDLDAAGGDPARAVDQALNTRNALVEVRSAEAAFTDEAEDDEADLSWDALAERELRGDG